MLWWIVAVVFVIFVYTYILKPQQHWQKLNVPHVKPWPFFGNMAPFVFRQRTIDEWIQDLYYSKDDQTRYIGFYSFLKPTLMIKDLNLIKQICIKEIDHFLDHPSIISEESDPLFGSNLFSLKGQRWRNMRSTLSPAFTGSKMRAMFVLMSDCAEQFVDYFSKLVDPKTPLTIEMKDAFTRYANDVIATTAFGIKCDSLHDKNNEFYLMGKDASYFGGIRGLKFFGYSISPALMKLFNVKLFSDEISNFFRNLIVGTIETREKQGIVRQDMIHLLMEARKGKLKHEEASKKAEDDAGFATVEESHIGKDSKQALIETLRKWSVAVATDRVCIDSYTIQPENPGEEPVKLVKDDIVWLPIYAVHRDPKYYSNPDKFDPERFSDENKGNIHPQAYMPFGVGPRNCIGSRFALLEIKIIFFHLLSKFNLVIVEKSQVPLRISRSEFNLNAENGFWLGLAMRN